MSSPLLLKSYLPPAKPDPVRRVVVARWEADNDAEAAMAIRRSFARQRGDGRRIAKMTRCDDPLSI
jgi:hypothetical protein